jgi:hypothetical protein
MTLAHDRAHCKTQHTHLDLTLGNLVNKLLVVTDSGIRTPKEKGNSDEDAKGFKAWGVTYATMLLAIAWRMA